MFFTIYAKESEKITILFFLWKILVTQPLFG